ncbi:Carboxylesterase [Bertholletia excelsa]
MSQFDAYEHLHISLNADGSLTRHLKLPNVAATDDSAPQGEIAASKDVVLDANKKTRLRIFRPAKLPSNDRSVARLPIVIYFHGGMWISFSVANAMVHNNCAQFAGEIPAIVVSVEYRLAPESRLPEQYDDAVDAILWVKNQGTDGAAGEKWLRDYGDFSRCYLYGICSGGNIAFNAALRALDLRLEPLKIAGLIMNQPMFSGKQRTESELKHFADESLPLPALDLTWELALPPEADRDHRYSNPMADPVYQEKASRLGRCLVIGFADDIMVDRQQELVQMLVAMGVPVEARFDDAGFHRIDLIDSRRAVAILSFVREFI